LTKKEVQTWGLTLSTGVGQATETLVGNSAVTVRLGFGQGGVMSGGVMWLTVLLFADRLPATSMAYTENVCVMFGSSFVRVSVVCGGSTRMHPPPFVCTQYQKFDELSVDLSHASETLVSVVAVMRRLVSIPRGRCSCRRP
jgi:hypothetical protein